MKTNLRFTAALLFAGISFAALSASATGTQPDTGDGQCVTGPEAITGPCNPDNGVAGTCSVSGAPGRSSGSGGALVPALALGFAFLWRLKRKATVR
ncbi:MAG TPA: hypothetical protein VHB79_35555 [Polyangiaceae bacterium]|nr:hypothetical protein [Polyangiaceae bacterium]